MVDGSQLYKRAMQALEDAGLKQNIKQVSNYIDRTDGENFVKEEYLIIVLTEKD